VSQARPSVRVPRRGDGSTVLEDTATGLKLELTGEDAASVEAAVQGGPMREEVAELFAELGLLAELSEPEARKRQAAFLVTLAANRDFHRVRAAIELAAAKTRFHQPRLGPLLPGLDAPAGISALPMMFKDELRQGFPDGVVVEGVDLGGLVADRTLIFASTSGTAGERLQVVSDTRLDSFPRDFEALWRVGPYPDGVVPRTAVFTTPVCAGPICHLGKSAMAERTEKGATLFLNSTDDVFAIDRALVENIFDELHRFAPHFLFVNPVYLSVLALRAKEWGFSFPPLDAIISDYQYLSVFQRRLLARHFRCPVYDYVGATDLGGSRVAVECAQGALHVRADHLFTEIVRGGRAASVGELGYLCFTTFNPTLPLIRYVTGDLAEWAASPCTCTVGAEWPALVFHGRGRDTLMLDGRRFTTRDVDQALAPLEGVDFYQLEETAPSAVRLKLVPSAGAPAPLEAARAALQALLGSAAQISVEATDRLRADRGQKFRFVVPLSTPTGEGSAAYPGLLDAAGLGAMPG
jgi:phenylacetate-CoA ligase